MQQPNANTRMTYANNQMHLKMPMCFVNAGLTHLGHAVLAHVAARFGSAVEAAGLVHGMPRSTTAPPPCATSHRTECLSGSPYHE